MRTYLFIGCAAALLTACASKTKVKLHDVNTVISGDKSAILASYGGKTACRGVVLRFRNVETGQIVNSQGLSPGWMKSAEGAQKKISIIPVSPGNYQFSGGSCSRGTGRTTSETADFRGVIQWFEPFEVNANEAVYPGTLVEERVSHKVDGVMDFVPEFIMRAPTRDYQIFDQEDRSAQVKERLAQDAPELISQFVVRLPDRRLKAETVKQILADAYAYEGKKKGPDARRANSKARSALYKYMRTGEYTPAAE